ncbi:MAG: hypothetical protein EOP52_02805 [Sphingobacteriales bacterium]|nr:MAG: hypothetical protein EOP52_02805 [Sphingobacteriales bacterium]
MASHPTATNRASDAYLTVSEFLYKTHIALTNGQLPDIGPLLEKRGITRADMAAKLMEVETLRRLHEQQRQEYGEQYNATKAYHTAWKAAHDPYMDAVRLGRLAFKNDLQALAALALRGDRAQSQGNYIAQGLTFYNNALANSSYQAALAQKGVTVADLQAGQAAFMDLNLLSATQRKEMGDAQNATQARDATYDALAEWMADFYETAKVALRVQPQLLEKLGIVAR